jgi:hypothetical protein
VLLLSFDPDIPNLHKLIMGTIIPKVRKWKKRLLLANMEQTKQD